MASTSPSNALYESDASSAEATPRSAARTGLPSGALSALVTLTGFGLCIGAGGATTLSTMLLRDDGLFISGVVMSCLLFVHGFKEWTALAIASPILAFSCFAFFRDHRAPLALFGAQIMLVGGFGLITQRWRAHWSPARTL